MLAEVFLKERRVIHLSAAILLAAGLAQTPAHARYGFFAEIGGGFSKNDMFEGIRSVASDDTGTFFSIGGGYDFNDKLGLEAGYVDLGEAEISPITTYTVTSSAKGLYVGPRLTLEFSRLVGAYGRAGMFAWDAEGKDNVGFSASQEGTDFYLGIGAAFRVLKKTWLAAEWTRYTMKGNEDVHVDVFGGKLKFSF